MPVKVDSSRLDRELQRKAAIMQNRAGNLFVAEVRRGMSRRTGEMYDSVEETLPTVAADRITSHVRVNADHGIYQDQGTGIYGPEGRPITPKKPGGVLVFDWPAAGGVVFARSVRGSPPTRFWQKAVKMWPFIVRRVGAGG